MTIEIDAIPNENGSIFITVSYSDPDGNDIPISSLNTALWLLKKTDGSIVNPGAILTDAPVLLDGDDLALFGFDDTDRYFCVVITYNTTIDGIPFTDVAGTEEAKFSIKDLKCQ